jgi:hypothetical protein
MLLRCHTAFGNFVPGDEIEVPDGAVFDGAHFEQAEPDKGSEKESK